MKFVSLVLAAMVLTASIPASAKAFRCINGELSGGPEGFTCRTDAEGRIVDVRKRAEPPYQYRSGHDSRSWSHSHYDGYTRSQIWVAPSARRGETYAYSSTAPRTATRVTRTYSYAAPGYSFGAPSYAPAPEVSEVRVYRAGRPGPTRPCTYSSPASSVTTYHGCSYSAGYEPVTYYDPAPELAGGATAPPGERHGYSRDYARVVGVQRGTCHWKIRRLSKDADGRPRYEVCYSDLQPVYGARVNQLYSRLRTAARRACGGYGGYGISGRRADCEDLALAGAVYDTGLQPLVNHHVAETGGRPMVIVGPLRRY